MAIESQSEIYKFVRDRYDKLQASRSMAQVRLGHLLVMSGFLIAGFTGVGVPQLILAFEVQHTFVSGWCAVTCTLAMVATGISLGCLLRQLFGAVTRYTYAIPNADRDTVKSAMDHPNIQQLNVVKQLTSLYLDSIELNCEEAGHVGRHLRKAFFWLLSTLVCGAVFLALLVLTRFLTSNLAPIITKGIADVVQ